MEKISVHMDSYHEFKTNLLSLNEVRDVVVTQKINSKNRELIIGKLTRVIHFLENALVEGSMSDLTNYVTNVCDQHNNMVINNNETNKGYHNQNDKENNDAET